MRKHILLLRHGQTDFNKEGRLPGQMAGVPLNEIGRQQALATGEVLGNIALHYIVSSPLERALDTARLMAESQPNKLEIALENGLMDTNLGPWNGQIISELDQSNHQWREYKLDPHTIPPGVEGVETFPTVQKRAVEVVERWLQKINDEEFIIFVSHGDVCKLILAYYMNWDIHRGKYLHIDNAAVSYFYLDDQGIATIRAIGWTPQPGWLPGATFSVNA